MAVQEMEEEMSEYYEEPEPNLCQICGKHLPWDDQDLCGACTRDMVYQGGLRDV